ncbi:hypothetical protein ACHWQZ_G019353 [Mnemiopsis leidyi]
MSPKIMLLETSPYPAPPRSRTSRYEGRGSRGSEDGEGITYPGILQRCSAATSNSKNSSNRHNRRNGTLRIQAYRCDHLPIIVWLSTENRTTTEVIVLIRTKRIRPAITQAPERHCSPGYDNKFRGRNRVGCDITAAQHAVSRRDRERGQERNVTIKQECAAEPADGVENSPETAHKIKLQHRSASNTLLLSSAYASVDTAIKISDLVSDQIIPLIDRNSLHPT